ncbi:MAG TPA: DUF222 domain-containing protein [Trebonia sp.]|nr:DUF222 domain-containing protein [Trebonia sp.]
MRATGPAAVDEAVALVHAGLDLLLATDWRALGAAAQARALGELAAAQSKLGVARSEVFGAFDQSGGYSADGHPSAQAWLRHRGKVTAKAARDTGAWQRTLGAHPLLRDALVAREVSESWAAQLARWSDRLPPAEVDKADEILLDAARSGLALRPDIARIAQAIYEAVRGQRPDQDPDDDGFEDRDAHLATTIGGAGRLQADLSARCAALLAQVFATFGKSTGAGDPRSQGQRDHDALEAALGLALASPDIPQSGGMKSRAMAVVSIADLLALDGAPALVDAWLTARAGEPGWFFGPAARAAACTAQVSPVVTGAPDWDVLSAMADVLLGERGSPHAPAPPGRGLPQPRWPEPIPPEPALPASSSLPTSERGSAHAPQPPQQRLAPPEPPRPCPAVPQPPQPCPALPDSVLPELPQPHPALPEPALTEPALPEVWPPAADLARAAGPVLAPAEASRGWRGPGAPPFPAGPLPLDPPATRPSPAGRLALERTLLALAVRALSGPDGLAGFLRANLLGRPFAGKSLVLDAGDTDDIPDHIRRAVILRDRHCQWPGGCDRPASQCEPHHGRPRYVGGETSLDNLDLYCLAHHHHFIHRLGWRVVRHPDGTRDAISPAGRVIRGGGAGAGG